MPNPSTNGQKKRESKAFLVTCLVFLAVFLSGEIYFRVQRSKVSQNEYGMTLTAYHGIQVGRANGLMKMRLSPYTVYDNLPDQRTKCFSTDSHGFRGPAVDLGTRKDLRLAIIGGSAAFGLVAATDEETFAGVLAREHPNWQVVNAGVAGFLSGQELGHLIHNVADIEPDVVVVFSGWNDLYAQWFGGTRMDHELGYNGNFQAVEIQLVQNYWSEVGIWRSFLRFFGAVVRKSAMIQDLGEMAAERARVDSLRAPPDDGIAGTEEYHRKIDESFLRNLTKMWDFCKGRQVRLIISVQPEIGDREELTQEEETILQNQPYYRNHFPERYDRLTAKVLHADTLVGADVLDIGADPQIRFSKEPLFADLVHYTRAGNEAVARILGREIATHFTNMKEKDGKRE